LVEDVDAEARASQLKFLKARLAEYEAKLAELLEAEKQNQIQGVLTIDGMPAPAQQVWPKQLSRIRKGLSCMYCCHRA
jgi:hypothetical protein